MAFVPVRRPRLNQQNGDGIDWSNPLTRGLFSAADANGFDAATSRPGTLYNTTAPTVVPTKMGRAVNFNNNQLDFTCGPYSDTNQTHLVIADISSGTWRVSAVNHGMVLRLFNGVVVVASRNYGNKFDSSAWTTIQPIIHRVGATEIYDQEFFISGKKASWVATVAFSETLTNGAIVTLGGSYTSDRSAATWWTKPVMLSARWNRALSNSEIESLSANPWQIFL